MNARRTTTGRRGRALAGLAVAAVISVSTGGGIASAATSSTLLYSTDGGATWTSDATVAAGGTVLVRQWYDNDGTAAETGASLATQLPEGFTLNGGSTQVCLNPSTTNPTSPDGSELVCASSNEGAVWSGTDLQVSPTAGLFGQSNGQTIGNLEVGRVRYVNLHQCTYVNTVSDQMLTVLVDTTGPGTGTNASNSADGAADCGSAGPVWTQDAAGANLQVLDLLGQRYLNLHQCVYQQIALPQILTVVVDSSGPGTGTNTSNSADGTADCGTTGPSWTHDAAGATVQAVDLFGQRYLNLHQCVYRRTASGDLLTILVDSSGPGTGTNASNSADGAGSCGTAGPAWVQDPGGAALQVFDLLDPARGRGYVEYSVTAPAAPTPEACASNPSATSEAFDQDGSLTSTPSGVQAASGTITVDWSALDEPCPVDPIPLGDPLVIAGGLGVLAGAAYVLHRRRMAIAA